MKNFGRVNRKRNTLLGWLALLIWGFLIFISENRNQTTAPPAVTISRSASPAPTGFAFFIPTPAPGLVPASGTPSSLFAGETARLAQEYPEAVLSAALGVVEGVRSIEAARVTAGPSVYAEVMVEAGRNSIRTADRLRLALEPVLTESFAEFVFLLDDGQQVSEYTYRDGIWTAAPL